MLHANEPFLFEYVSVVLQFSLNFFQVALRRSSSFWRTIWGGRWSAEVLSHSTRATSSSASPRLSEDAVTRTLQRSPSEVVPGTYLRSLTHKMDTNDAGSKLLSLPTELLENVLAFLDPYDVVTFGQVCHYAATFISPFNHTVWRNTFLQMFDDPNKAWSALLPTARSENAPKEAAWNWYSKTHERCTALTTMTTTSKVYRSQNLELTTNALVDIIETAYSRPSTKRGSSETSADYEHRKSVSISTLQEAFSRCREAERAIHDWEIDFTSLPTVPSELAQSQPARPVTRSMASRRHSHSENASKVHTWFGLTKRERQSIRSQGNARCIVYDWHLTGPEVEYGPFKDGESGQWGQVNWKSVEAVSSLISRHMEILVKDQVSLPTGFRYALPCQAPSDTARPEDWAGVTGGWLGTYSFLDWTVLHQYNSHRHENGGRPLLEGCDEAHGDLMHLELHLDDSLKTDLRLATSIPVCEDLPMLYFSGTSRGTGASRPYIRVRGTTSLIPGARQVRWRFIIK